METQFKNLKLTRLLLTIPTVLYGVVPPIMGVDANLLFFTPLAICLLIGLVMSFNLERPAPA
jgi:hypothetical protein